MVERCIYADDFLDLFYVASAGQDKMFVKVVEQVVENTPTADVVEVKRGEWIRPTTVGGMTIAGLPHCSVCGVVPCDEGKYCPNCGADMRGEK